MILHTVHTKTVAALQGVEIKLFVRIETNIALGSFLCYRNYSDHLFDVLSRYRGVIINSKIIIRVNTIIKPLIIFKTVI
jgi:hypothetical protein